MARGWSLLCALLLALVLALAAAPAAASRALLDEQVVDPAMESSQVPEKQIEGACGVAILGGEIYVSDYYHHAVDVFGGGSLIPVGAPNGPCGLATSTAGALYANIWHESVVRLLPSPLTIDEGGESTGVAVDQATGNVYVNDRTYVAVYDPAGEPVPDKGNPPSDRRRQPWRRLRGRRLGRQGLRPRRRRQHGQGLRTSGRSRQPRAWRSTARRLRSRASARSSTPPSPSIPPTGTCSSSTTCSRTSSTRKRRSTSSTPPAPSSASSRTRWIDGEPSGLAFSGANLYATSGNSEEANVFLFGPYALAPDSR